MSLPTRVTLGLAAGLAPGLAIVGSAAGVARADSGASHGSATTAGIVQRATSRWTADGSRIVTTATIQTAGGAVEVSQLGGDAEGLAMRQFPAQPLLQVGGRVTVASHLAADTAGLAHRVVDEVVYAKDQPAGFVRSGPSDHGHFLYWEPGCVELVYDAAGTTEIAGDDEFAAIDQAVATWNTGVAGCSYMSLVPTGRQAMEVGRDHLNVIKFRDTVWGRPAIGDDPARPNPQGAAGLTTVTFVNDPTSARDGALVDTDVELNGVQFTIAIHGVTAGPPRCHAELGNTLTHELGHLLGLEHTCRVPGDEARTDNAGNPVPACADATDPAIVEATMYNFEECGETSKESLSPDDIAGVCAVYARADDPGTCGDDGGGGGGGCSSAARTPDDGVLAALGLSLLAGGLVLGPRRRRRR